MIVTRLIGGLGNQLFQYALGCRLSAERGTPLRIDASAFDRYKRHRYALDHFNVEAEHATGEEVSALTRGNPVGLERWLPRRWVPKPLRGELHPTATYARERRPFTYDPEVIPDGNSIYLRGFWQSEKYFCGAEPLIRDSFRVRTPPSPKNRLVATEIRACESVSLHVRRGDYAHDAEVNERHGLCTLDYYRAAVDHLASRVNAPRYFVFSDDPAWARDHLDLGVDKVVLDHNDAAANYEDLRLMSLCRHNIIANSSFSWWGAWLNENPEKIVIAPARWMARPEDEGPDVVPDSWIKL